jgi:hypothetical protein
MVFGQTEIWSQANWELFGIAVHAESAVGIRVRKTAAVATITIEIRF